MRNHYNRNKRNDRTCKKRKATGPDEIPMEIFKEMNE